MHILRSWIATKTCFPRQEPVEQEFRSSFPPSGSPLGGLQLSQVQVSPSWAHKRQLRARDPTVPWILMTYESMNSVRQRAYSKGRWDQCQDWEINLNVQKVQVPNIYRAGDGGSLQSHNDSQVKPQHWTQSQKEPSLWPDMKMIIMTLSLILTMNLITAYSSL